MSTETKNENNEQQGKKGKKGKKARKGHFLRHGMSSSRLEEC
jgi:hypothetical protein